MAMHRAYAVLAAFSATLALVPAGHSDQPTPLRRESPPIPDRASIPEKIGEPIAVTPAASSGTVGLASSPDEMSDGGKGEPSLRPPELDPATPPDDAPQRK